MSDVELVGKDVAREGPQPAQAASAPAPGRLTNHEAHEPHTAERGPDGSVFSPTAVAEGGTRGAGGRLPHHERIQRAFGRHDVGGIRSFVGGDAAHSASKLGAQAYASGDAVAFAGAPDLHTAAHEAAHVIQQKQGVQLKGGLDGGANDPYERHADAVADAVVAGHSAEGLLDQAPGGGGGSAAAVQRKGNAKGDDKQALEAKIDAAKKKLKADEDHLEDLDKNLGIQLDNFAPAMSTAQLMTFVKIYRAKHHYKQVQKDIKDDERDLAAALKKAGKVEDAADHGDDKAVESLIDANQQLAGAGKASAKQAMKWAHSNLGSHGFKRHNGDLHEIITLAKHTYSEALLAEVKEKIDSGDNKTLLKRIDATADHLLDELEAVGDVVKLGSLPALVKQFKVEFRSGNAKRARDLFKALKHQQPMVRRVLTGFYSAAKMSELAATMGDGALEKLSHFKEHSKALADALHGSKGAKKTEAVLNNLRSKAKLATAAAEKVSKFLPLIGVAATGEAAVKQIIATIDHPNISNFIKLYGDYLQVVGSVLEMAPPPIDLVGSAVNIIGSAICAIVSFFSGPDENTKEAREILKKMGFNDAQISVFTDKQSGSAKHNFEDARKWGMSPQEIQKSVSRHPDMWKTERAMEHAHNCWEWSRHPPQGQLHLSFADFFTHVSNSPKGTVLIGNFINDPNAVGGYSKVPPDPNDLSVNTTLFMLMAVWGCLKRPSFSHYPDKLYGKPVGQDHASDKAWHTWWDHNT